jgi:hypothetical protein
MIGEKTAQKFVDGIKQHIDEMEYLVNKGYIKIVGHRYYVYKNNENIAHALKNINHLETVCGVRIKKVNNKKVWYLWMEDHKNLNVINCSECIKLLNDNAKPLRWVQPKIMKAIK